MWQRSNKKKVPIRLRHVIHKFCENFVCKSIAPHLRGLKICNICKNVSQPVDDEPKLSSDNCASESPSSKSFKSAPPSGSTRAQRLQLSTVTPTATSASVWPRILEADWPPYDAPYFMNGDGASVVVF